MIVPLVLTISHISIHDNIDYQLSILYQYFNARLIAFEENECLSDSGSDLNNNFRSIIMNVHDSATLRNRGDSIRETLRNIKMQQMGYSNSTINQKIKCLAHTVEMINKRVSKRGDHPPTSIRYPKANVKKLIREQAKLRQRKALRWTGAR